MLLRTAIEIKKAYIEKNEILKKIRIEKSVLKTYNLELKAINKKLDNWLNHLLEEGF